MDNGRAAIKIGLLAGVVSALFPSIPTIVKFGYHHERWFQIYVVLSIILIAIIFVVV